MNRQRFLELLEHLKSEADDPIQLRHQGEGYSWQRKILRLLLEVFGEDDPLVARMLSLNFEVNSSYDQDHERAFVRWVKDVRSVINDAIYYAKLGNSALSDLASPIVKPGWCDPDLWEHVESAVTAERWMEVASRVEIYVEDRVRRWCGNPKDIKGNVLVGKALYAKVFADDAPYRLGRQQSEWEGWRSLSVGFALALGNVDRHNIQSRDDAERYAFGVLGTGSLLLTQLKYEHGNKLRRRRPNLAIDGGWRYLLDQE